MWNNIFNSGFFYIIAAAVIIFALLSVTLRNMFHSALSVIAVLLGVSAVYIYLDAEFLALIQILIYVGAVMTLIIFAIMLTFRISDKDQKQHNRYEYLSFLICTTIASILIYIFINFKGKGLICLGGEGLRYIGKELLTVYILPFEIISLILLAALIGAVVINRRE